MRSTAFPNLLRLSTSTKSAIEFTNYDQVMVSHNLFKWLVSGVAEQDPDLAGSDMDPDPKMDPLHHSW